MNQRIFVTGGTGFVGSYLLRYLLDRGYRNIVALRRADSSMDLVEGIKAEVDWVTGDLLDYYSLEDAMKSAEEVYHCAAIISFDPGEVDQMMQVNREGTANVVNAALHHDIKKLVHVSSIAAIGRSRDGARLEEASSWQKSKLNSNYAISKFLAEQEVWRGMAEGLKAAIVNPSVILGAGRWDEGALQYFGLIWNKFPFYPVGATGFVDVRDLAVAMIRLMESNITGERFIISSENRTYRSVFNKIAECLDKRPPYLAANRLIRPFAWRLSWLQQKIFGGKRTITRETALLSSKTFYFDNSKSAEQLGMQYRPLDTTIEESSLKFIRSASHSFSSAVLPVT